MRVLGRRVLLASAFVAALGAAGSAAVTARASVAPPPDGVRRYVVTRPGSGPGTGDIGTHEVRFRRTDKGVVVEHKVRVVVKVVFVTAYRYESDRTETWEDDKLVAFRAHTNDNGDTKDVTAARVDDGLQVRGGAGSLKAAPETGVVGPAWNVLGNARPHQLIDADSGKLLNVAVSGLEGSDVVTTKGGRQIICQRVRVSGQYESTMWFGPDGTLVMEKMKARDGSLIETTLQ